MITSRMLPRQLTLPPHPPAKLTPSLSHSCSLFSLFFAHPSFRIRNLQPLFPKHPGWGYLRVSSLLESITSSLFFQNALSHPDTTFGPSAGVDEDSRCRRCLYRTPGFLSSENERRRNCSSTNCFRINTCKSVSKQMTLTPFTINTYAKTRGEGRPFSSFRNHPHRPGAWGARVLCAPISVPSVLNPFLGGPNCRLRDPRGMGENLVLRVPHPCGFCKGGFLSSPARAKALSVREIA